MNRHGMTMLLLTGGAMIGVASASAQTAPVTGTAAGTSISNTARATYTVNGVAQTATSNTASFVVDRKVDLALVRDQAANTEVARGQTGAVTAFRLTNLTNGAQDFLLDADQVVLAGLLTGTDDFDMTNVKVFADGNGNGQYDAGVDTAAYVDELAPDASVSVFIVADVPNSATATLSFVSLDATAAAGGSAGVRGAALIPTPLNTLNADAEVDVVFADGDSDGSGRDDARNGEARAYAAYEVGGGGNALTVLKSSRVLADGLDGLGANPKALPGATVEYCLTVRNNMALTAVTDVTLTDLIPANTRYVAGSIQVGTAGGALACVVGGVAEDDDASDAGEGDAYRGSFDTGANRVSATVPTLAGGATVAASFRVTID